MKWISCVLCVLLNTGLSSAKNATTPSAWQELEQNLVKSMEGKEDTHCPLVEDGLCPRREVTFWLYNRYTFDIPIELNPHFPGAVYRAMFVRKAPLKVLIHGYTMDKDSAINELLRPAYLSSGAFNIISVDWSPLCREHCYVEAARNVPTVGHCVAEMISKLIKTCGNVFGDVHVLGHSLGAHVAARASTELNLPRLTEFDPALPLFRNQGNLFKKGTAGIVDVWHSNANIKGRDSADGTVDIYFNDEMDQPGCKCDSSCSHLRAVEYYRETIVSRTPLTAFPCPGGWKAYRQDQCQMPVDKNLAYFGEHMSTNRTGVFLAFTNVSSPFIIPASSYLTNDSFKSFQTTHDENCKTHDLMAFFTDLFN